MDIEIQKQHHLSIREQLVHQISRLVATGLLKPGAKLPSIRVLSRKLDIHHNTCLYAYRKLSQLGIIQIRRGSGSRVATLSVPGFENGIANELTWQADFFAQQMTRQGFLKVDVFEALETAYNQLTLRRAVPVQGHQRPVVLEAAASSETL